MLYGARCRADACIVGYRAGRLIERHIEINPNEGSLSSKIVV
jgi:hypothetical protein